MAPSAIKLAPRVGVWERDSVGLGDARTDAPEEGVPQLMPSCLRLAGQSHKSPRLAQEDNSTRRTRDPLQEKARRVV